MLDKLPPLDQLSSEQKDELIIELFSLVPLVKELKLKILELEKEVADLKSKLNRNSQNSHQPPSKDCFNKPKNLRTKSDKPSGGQTGHRGRTLRESDKPDRKIKHLVNQCFHCHLNLKEVHSLNWKKAQVFDIAELKIEVDEHLVEEKICPRCQNLCSASLPEGVIFGTQYGTKIRALATYLHNYHYLASHRVTEFFQDIFSHTLSEGMVFNSDQICFNHLASFDQLIKKALINSSVNHVDETGLRALRKLSWLHVVSTSFSSYFSIHSKRGKQAIDEIGILPHFKGVLVHDHFKVYFQYGFEHALCNAHHLRELQGIFETTGHKWATKMQELLLLIKKDKDTSRLSSKTIQVYEKQYDEILYLGYSEQKERSPPSYPKEICLLDRLRNYKSQTLLFMHQEDVAFDNNQAERDIRMMKLKMKVSGCFRSWKRTKIFCLIRSYISTIKKNGMAIFQSLVDVFHGLSPLFLSSLRFS